MFNVHCDFKEFTKTISGEFKGEIEQQPNKYSDLQFDYGERSIAFEKKGNDYIEKQMDVIDEEQTNEEFFKM